MANASLAESTANEQRPLKLRRTALATVIDIEYGGALRPDERLASTFNDEATRLWQDTYRWESVCRRVLVFPQVAIKVRDRFTRGSAQKFRRWFGAQIDDELRGRDGFAGAKGSRGFEMRTWSAPVVQEVCAR